jgi:DNA topoisomerase III
VPGDYATLTVPCPKCGGEVRENYKKFACTSCDFNFYKILASRQLSDTEAATLLSQKRVGPLEGFRSKLGRTFSADLILKETFEIEFYWENQAKEGEDLALDLSAMTPLGDCPKCKHKIYDIETAYLCEKGMMKPRVCDFRSGKIILQQPIEPEQMVKLLTEGKTDLLPKFISTKTRRPFAAYLMTKKDGSIGFEFAPREPKAPKAPAAKKVSKTAKKAAAE